jgi:hypothetical protein
MGVDEGLLADLVARRRMAEQAVEDMPEGPRKERAFEIAFRTLVESVPTKGTRMKTRKSTKRKPTRARVEERVARRPRPGAGPRRQLTALVEEGFFDEWKGLPDIVQGLQARGHSYRQENLSKPLQRMTQADTLRRQRRQRERGRTIWVYRRSGIAGNGSG